MKRTNPNHAGALGPPGQPLTGHTGPAAAVAFSPDGKILATATGSADGTVRLWSLADPAHPASLGQPLTGHTGVVTAVTFSPDGDTWPPPETTGTVRLWDLDLTHWTRRPLTTVIHRLTGTRLRPLLTTAPLQTPDSPPAH